MLSPAVLQGRPLLAASLALLEGNRRLAEANLASADVTRLDVAAQQQWLALVEQMDARAQLLDRLGRPWQEKRLPPLLMRAYAEHARIQGRGELHDAVWASLHGKPCTSAGGAVCGAAPSLMRVRQ